MKRIASLPFYAAAGIPLPYVVLLEATTALTDPALTMLNSTGFLLFTAIVCRLGLGRTDRVETAA